MTTSAGTKPHGPYESWSIPDVGLAHEARSREIAELRRRARAEGHAEGYAAGRDAGHAAGYQAGREAAEADYGPYAGRLQSILSTLASPLDGLDAEVEQNLVALALHVARQIVFDAVTASPETVLAAVREARATLPLATRAMVVQLHPHDAEMVRAALDADEAAAWSIREDAELTRGGCRIETETSTVDATVEARLDSVISQVLGGVDRLPEST